MLNDISGVPNWGKVNQQQLSYVPHLSLLIAAALLALLWCLPVGLACDRLTAQPWIFILCTHAPNHQLLHYLCDAWGMTKRSECEAAGLWDAGEQWHAENVPSGGAVKTSHHATLPFWQPSGLPLMHQKSDGCCIPS
jgi:hypothetical protein